MATPGTVVTDPDSKLGLHGYGPSNTYTIGVEEEFQLVHTLTGDLVNRVDVLLGQATEDDLAKLKPELMQSVIEVATGVCANAAAAEDDLRSLRQRISSLATASDCAFASAGTHPFARYEFQQVTERERYQNIVETLQWIAKRELIFGLHVHVGIDDPEKAMYVFNHVRGFLPQLLALSANSPFWQGRRTGLASSRSKVFDSFPRSGMPPAFESYAAWDAQMQRAIKAGAIADYTYIWWDVRPHPTFGTIEIRICDAQTRLEDTLAISALVQAVCAWLGERWEAGDRSEAPETFFIEENKWSAARYGLEGDMLDLENDLVRVPTRELLSRLFERVSDVARDLGSAEQFAALDSLLLRNGAARQVEVYEQTGSLMSVAKMLVADTRACVNE